jgi:hypothetical protein
MGLLIAEMAAKRAGEVVCGELLRRGLEPTTLEVQVGGGDVIIALTILREWTKGFVLDAKTLAPEVVEEKLERWKAKTHGDILAGQPSKVVRQAIQRYGQEAVTRALAPRFGFVT